MGEIAVGKGNWANASARSKARKAKLIDAARTRQQRYVHAVIDAAHDHRISTGQEIGDRIPPVRSQMVLDNAERVPSREAIQA